MRGYLSFLLVLCIMVCMFAFLQAFPELHSFSSYRAIEAERTNAVSMNVKEALTLSTSYWLRASAEAYDVFPEAEKNPVEREVAIKAGILSGWALLDAHQFDEEFEVQFWCAYVTDGTKAQLSEEMVEQGRALSPNGAGIFPADCAGFIQVDQEEPGLPESTDSVRLSSPSPYFTSFGVVGASIYSPKYETANVVYLPATEVIR